MKLENIAIFGAVALGVYLIASKGLSLFGGARAGVVTGAGPRPSTAGTREIITNAVPGSPGYGWRYFTDGTSISPDGIYYRNGEQIWPAPWSDNAAMAASYDGVSVGNNYSLLAT